MTALQQHPHPSPVNVEEALRHCEALRARLTDRHVNDKTDPSVLILLNAIMAALNSSPRLPCDADVNIDDISEVSLESSSDDEERKDVSCDSVAFDSAENKIPHVEPVASYKSETEITLGRIFSIGAASAVADPSILPYAPYSGPSVISMTSFGELGRWGNQILQYMFLKSYATKHNVRSIQIPAWVGATLFSLSDEPVRRALPPAIEFRETKANSTFTQDLLDYVVRQHAPNKVSQIDPNVLSTNTLSGAAPTNVDIWGWFQWHTRHLAPFRRVIQETLVPNAEIASDLSRNFLKNVRYRGGVKRTVVGLHLRLGDYKNIAASSFGYVAPTSWYLSWLQTIWGTLDNPVLFVASDDIDTVLRDFEEYSPITAESAGISMPSCAENLNAGFFPDWYCLTQCDVLAISNSTFSFTAALLNHRTNGKFFRAHYSGMLEQFDPWNAEPVVHRDLSGNLVSKALDTLRVVFRTQGAQAVAKNVLYEMPCYGVRSVIMKAVLWRRAIM